MEVLDGKGPLDVSDIGVGATEELSLRVSVATLARIVFEHPDQGILMLALERVATLREEAGRSLVTVKAQPFGGAVRLRRLAALSARIGPFNFDSERSREERDFRIQIRRAYWEPLKRFCLEQLQNQHSSVLEPGPERELGEEFADALGVTPTSAQYRLKHLGIVIQNSPRHTDNVHAVGRATVRIYSLFEVALEDPALIRAMLDNSARVSDQRLRGLALQDARQGGKGRGNGVLTLPAARILQVYRRSTPRARAAPLTFEGHLLDGNVAAVLPELWVPGWQRL